MFAKDPSGLHSRPNPRPPMSLFAIEPTGTQAQQKLPLVAAAMKAICLAIAMLALAAPAAPARIIDWQAELARCRALHENATPLLQAGVGISAVARSGVSVRRCIWIERRAARKGITGAETH
jgi:hypothetical protein